MFVTIVMIVTAIAFVWLMVYGGTMNESDEEKFWDDEEQMKYLKEKEKKHKNKKQLSTNNAKKVEKWVIWFIWKNLN